MNRSAIRITTTSLAALALAQFATAAQAAEPAAEPAAADAADPAADQSGPAQTGAFSEIIVSATKRETDLQKTPIAISVVDPQTMKDRHIQSLLDLGDGAAPSLRVATFEARQSALTIGIRGIVPFDANQTARDQGVGVYIDGVYLGRQQGLNAALFDVERIEVLRGPQGTLFGRNTEGGAVSIVTKDPTGEFGGRIEGGLGNYGSYSTQAHINLPEFANIAIKIDGLIQHQDATTTNPLEGQYGWNYYNRAGGRITAKWTPTSDFTAVISYDKAKDENTPFLSQLINFNPNGRPVGTFVGTKLTCPPPATSCIAPLAPLVEVSGNHRQGESEIGVIQQPSVDRTEGVMGKLEYQLGDAILLRSITAYRKVDTDQWDASATAHRSAFAPNGNFGRYSLSKMWEHQFSQELQIVGTMPQVDWVIGGYYFDERAQEEAATPNPMKWNADGTAYTINSETRPNPNAPISSSNQGWAYRDWFKQRGSYADTTSLAVFGQATFTPAGLDILHLTAGGRYTHDERKGVLYMVSGIATDWELDYSDNRFDPMVTLALDVTPEINVYAKYSTGYRAGGANARSSNFQPFGPESVKAYEAGAKMSLLDDHVRLNIAGYIMDRKDTQIDFDNVDTVQFLPGTTIPNPTYNLHTENTANAPGTSKIRGFEAELSAKPVRDLTLGASYAYTYSDIPETANPNPGPTFGQLTQVFVVFTPKHALSGFLDYDTMLSDSGIGLRFHVDANYAGPQYSFQSENVLTESSFIVNGRIALTDIPLTEAGTTLTLALWGRNLLNEDHIYRRSDANNATIGSYANFNPPRTFGLEGTINF
ncbi:MAG TPA: TonB-dependent receptor [Croceibacterium sp.]|nr:TonB-dependent receptor [Croceibacterium sp.]